DVAPDVLRHRLVLSYEALAQATTADQILARVLSTVPAPRIAPADRGLYDQDTRLRPSAHPVPGPAPLVPVPGSPPPDPWAVPAPTRDLPAPGGANAFPPFPTPTAEPSPPDPSPRTGTGFGAGEHTA
ncbi:MAG: hypothetical protein WKF43_06315, partial [Acidimicrobiales bacterium]